MQTVTTWLTGKGGCRSPLCTAKTLPAPPPASLAVGRQTPSPAPVPDVPCRLYQAINAQHVVCQQYTTQAACQSTPTSVQLQCAWDSLNSRCMADPYASLLMPLSCMGSKARSFMTCGRKGHMNACRTDTDCVLGKQARCFPAWLVSEARAKNTTEQDVAEAMALAILKGTADQQLPRHSRL